MKYLLERAFMLERARPSNFKGGIHLGMTKKFYNTANLPCSAIFVLEIVVFYNKGVKKGT